MKNLSITELVELDNQVWKQIKFWNETYGQKENEEAKDLERKSVIVKSEILSRIRSIK